MPSQSASLDDMRRSMINHVINFFFRNGSPTFLCVFIENYSGPELYRNEKNQPIIPIFPITREFIQGTNSCTRSQFPITIAFAITVHKSQGLTMQQAVLDLSRPQFVSGLNYVAVSRLKGLEGSIFDKPFDLDVIRKGGGGKTAEGKALDWVRCSNQLIPL